MVPNRRRRMKETQSAKPAIKKPIVWVVVVAVLTLCLGIIASKESLQTYDVSFLMGSTTTTSKIDNGEAIQTWKTEFEENCKTMLESNNNEDTTVGRQKKREVEEEAISKIVFPSSVTGTPPSDHVPYQFCRNVFIDLGTNIGDSIGYFVDSALDVCTAQWLDVLPKTRMDNNFPRPHLDVSTREIRHEGVGGNPLYGMIQSHLRSSDPPISANSFCVYGMEGNPEFTDRLQKLENHVMGAQPRPIQHLHIHTESVVTAIDGPTKLYLDKTSVENNFWGSSILSSQQDAVKSAKELGSGQVFSADVQGITLSTLAKRTALAYKPDATAEEQTGGLIIIKMDVEGAEYQVLKEVAASGVLCDLAKKGNRVVMIVEYHNMSITDAEERRREKSGVEEAKQKLAECGVSFGTLQAFWK